MRYVNGATAYSMEIIPIPRHILISIEYIGQKYGYLFAYAMAIEVELDASYDIPNLIASPKRTRVVLNRRTVDKLLKRI